MVLKGYVGDTDEKNDKLVLTDKAKFGCHEKIYFALNIGRGCEYTKVYRNRNNADKTLPLFSSLSTASDKYNRVEVASKFELWAKFVGEPNLKKEMDAKLLFRYPNQVGINFMAFLELGQTPPMPDDRMLVNYPVTQQSIDPYMSCRNSH